ncbi:MAG: hypothetical protein EBZ49_08730 [Proteobacteria bacterium]|nr:hypothetical protein [Pseudomonadota bacterium]
MYSPRGGIAIAQSRLPLFVGWLNVMKKIFFLSLALIVFSSSNAHAGIRTCQELQAVIAKKAYDIHPILGALSAIASLSSYAALSIFAGPLLAAFAPPLLIIIASSNLLLSISFMVV